MAPPIVTHHLQNQVQATDPGAFLYSDIPSRLVPMLESLTGSSKVCAYVGLIHEFLTAKKLDKHPSLPNSAAKKDMSLDTIS